MLHADYLTLSATSISNIITKLHGPPATRYLLYVCTYTANTDK